MNTKPCGPDFTVFTVATWHVVFRPAASAARWSLAELQYLAVWPQDNWIRICQRRQESLKALKRTGARECGGGGKAERGSVLRQWLSGPPTLPYLQYSCYLHSKRHTASDRKADGNGHWEWVDTNSDFVESNATNLESQFHRLLAVIKELFNLFEAPISHL